MLAHFCFFRNDLYSFAGKPVQQKINKGKDKYGKTTYDCLDGQNIIRKYGEEYMRPNKKFRYKCENGTEAVIGYSLVFNHVFEN